MGGGGGRGDLGARPHPRANGRRHAPKVAPAPAPTYAATSASAVRVEPAADFQTSVGDAWRVVADGGRYKAGDVFVADAEPHEVTRPDGTVDRWWVELWVVRVVYRLTTP